MFLKGFLHPVFAYMADPQVDYFLYLLNTPAFSYADYRNLARISLYPGANIQYALADFLNILFNHSLVNILYTIT